MARPRKDESTARNNQMAGGDLQKIKKSDPVLGDLVEGVFSHYEKKYFDQYELSKMKLAFVTFVQSRNFDDAEDKLAQKMVTIPATAHRLLLQALNDCPSDLQKNEEWFEGMGMIRGLKKYYPMYPAIGPDSDFQKLRPKIRKEHMPLLRAAIDTIYSSKTGLGIIMHPRNLAYMTAQLIPDEKERASVFESFKSRDMVSNGYNYALRKSASGLVRIAQELKIDISDVTPVTEEGLVIKSKEKKTLAEIANIAIGAVDQPGKDVSENNSWEDTKKKLIALNNLRRLTDQELKIAIFLLEPREGRVAPKDTEVVLRFGKGISTGARIQEKKVDYDYVRDLRSKLDDLMQKPIEAFQMNARPALRR